MAIFYQPCRAAANICPYPNLAELGDANAEAWLGLLCNVAYRVTLCRWRCLPRGAASHRTNRTGVGDSCPRHKAFGLEQVGCIAVLYGLVVSDVTYLAVSARVGARYFREFLPDRNRHDAGGWRLCGNWDRSSTANEHRSADTGASAVFFGMLILQIVALRISFLPGIAHD